MMVPRKQGLIVNVSSVGGLSYLFNVAYGVGKVAVGYSINIHVAVGLSFSIIPHPCVRYFLAASFCQQQKAAITISRNRR